MKVNKSTKSPKKSAAEEAEEASEATAVEVAEVAEDSVADAEPDYLEDTEPEPAPAPVVATVPSRGEDMVEVTMFETIDPAPTVGHYSVRMQQKLAKLEERKNYVLPRNVALVLVDARKAAIVKG